MGFFGNRRQIQPMREQRQPRQQTERPKKCRIITKRKADGTIERSMEGCSPQELKALMEINERDMEDSDK